MKKLVSVLLTVALSVFAVGGIAYLLHNDEKPSGGGGGGTNIVRPSDDNNQGSNQGDNETPSDKAPIQLSNVIVKDFMGVPVFLMAYKVDSSVTNASLTYFVDGVPKDVQQIKDITQTGYFTTTTEDLFGENFKDCKIFMYSFNDADASEVYTVKAVLTERGTAHDTANIQIKNGESGWQILELSEAELTSIDLDYSAAKREYIANSVEYGTFSTDGLKVVAHFADGSEENIPLSYLSISTPEMYTVGVKTVVVSYTAHGKTLSKSYQIYCIPDVIWETNRLQFTAQNGGSLDLFVTQRSLAQGQVHITLGEFLYKAQDGHYEIFHMRYVLDQQYISSFYCDEGISCSLNESGDLISIVMSDTAVFSVNANEWHRVVLGWN